MSRKEEINTRAYELGQTCFPDECNIWARENYEAQKVEWACKQMVEWADEHPNTEDIETVLAYTYKGLGWLAENVEFDMGTMGDRALACTETLQLICNQAIMELRNPNSKKIKL